jgi:HSP20 family protein
MAYPFDRQSEEMQGTDPNQAVKESFGQSQGWTEPQESFEAPASTPPIDVYDSNDEITVFVDLPGFEEDDIRIQGDETNLVVSAERSNDPGEGASPLVQERARTVERTIPLHAPVDVSEATARHRHGVCEVVLPKTAAEQYREITLRSG